MFVLDASVTLSWFLDDEVSDYATKVLNALIYDQAIVPSLWVTEVSNVLNVGLKRARIQKEALFNFIRLLSKL
jgi:predicted nucleic acid-binding protein